MATIRSIELVHGALVMLVDSQSGTLNAGVEQGLCGPIGMADS